MKRRTFLAMVTPVVATSCVGMGWRGAAPNETDTVEPGQEETTVRRGLERDRGESLRRLMDRARDRRRKRAKQRRDRRRERLARARRRRRLSRLGG